MGLTANAMLANIHLNYKKIIDYETIENIYEIIRIFTFCYYRFRLAYLYFCIW